MSTTTVATARTGCRCTGSNPLAIRSCSASTATGPAWRLVREGVPHDMAEFFVMRKYRRGGVGTEAARGLFARFPGAWQVRQMRFNPQATVFWRRAIPVPFEDDENDDGPLQRFTIG